MPEQEGTGRASEDAKPLTFVDYAELIWRKLAEPGATQQKIADDLRWGRAQVSQYAMLNKLCSDAWSVVATSFSNTVADSESDDVADIATDVAKSKFSENLLRNILDLQPDQQIDLCKRLVKGKDSKGHKFGKADFKAEAEGYRALNALVGLAQSQLTAIIPGKFFFVFGDANPPWEMLEIDIETGRSTGVSVQLGIDHSWSELWKQLGLTDIRNTLRDWVGQP